MFKIPSFKSFYSQSDVQAVLAVIDRSMFWADGPDIEEFEHNITAFTGVNHALAFNSGTSALLSGLLAIDVKDREVICPSFTFIASANAIELAGGTAVFADCEPDTYGLDVASVAAKITPRTKAVMTIDYGGCVSRDVLALRRLCDEHGLLLIEDAAQSFGARADGAHAGFHSDFAIFSFCQNKVITALGEGGALITNNAALHNKAKYLRSHGRVDEPGKKHFETSVDNEYLFPGYNFRMPSVNAAFASSQLRNIDEHLSRRRKVAERYQANLAGLPMLRLPVPPAGHSHCYQMYTVALPDNTLRDGLREHLLAAGVQVRCYFEPLHHKPYFRNKNPELRLPMAERLGGTVLTLPMFPALRMEEVDSVCQLIQQFFNNATQAV
ncbi:DegT/DnrJ/EryC1/StrS family aminotransferase [Pseudoduganella armeniaca]|uniref:DegT/DnrJ/EryC1/StrS family aminotransferase n=1 Tax=Pseudoduganella armeniaca TaxID=2072590 RepID=A0A2R4CGZ6_9BURK|nr:DegT/DnrJ/EryC1/StrS family aminotransferase [Pseudoduganella armeniaca]AVR98923.1 DegT/DnrJ/EryC1/StrS family aminotransferase [Pseudoduganella armeniaca]